jgi:hypothetical protein
MNITPIFAVAILLPHVTSNSYLQLLIPLLMMLTKDFFIGFHSLMFPVYACTILFCLLGKYLKPITATFTGVFVWHIVVNYAVWHMYGGDLLQTYIQAIPFDFNLLVSTLICVLLGDLCIKYYYRYYSY